jgi:accessory gene regulator B
MNLLARRIARLLAENANKSLYEDEIRYGLEIALGGLVQIIIIMTVAILLGMGKESLALIGSVVLYRRYSGGAHCQSYYRCTIVSLSHIILLAYICIFIPVSYLPAYITFLAILAIFTIQHYVPVDNLIDPIKDEPLIRKRKQKSYGVLFLLLSISWISSYIMGENLVAIALLLGLFWQSITLLPAGQAYIHLWDQLFDIIKTKFKREGVLKC